MSVSMRDKSKEKQWLLKNEDAYKKNENWYSRRLTLIRRITDFPSGLRCLDVGSGMGLFSIFLALNRFDVSAIEPDDELIERSKDNFNIMNVKCNVQKGKAENIPFKSNSFDGVFSSSVLEHVNDWRLALAEMVRVLKPGGIFYLFTSNRQCLFQNEVNDFPFFSWLPQNFQRRYVQYCIKYRPDKINFTQFPVRVFFTYGQHKNELRKLNCYPYEAYELYNPNYFIGWRKGLRCILSLLKNPLILWAIHFRERGITLYARKLN